MARCTLAAHPCGFTKITRLGSENGRAGSRLTSETGISQGIRVLCRVCEKAEVELMIKWAKSLPKTDSCNYAQRCTSESVGKTPDILILSMMVTSHSKESWLQGLV